MYLHKVNDSLETLPQTLPASAAKPAVTPEQIEARLNELTKKFIEEYLFVLNDSYVHFVEAIQLVNHSNLTHILSNWQVLSKGKISHNKFRILKDTDNLVREFHDRNLAQISRYLQVGSAQFLKELKVMVAEMPAWLTVHYSEEELAPTSLDDFRARNIKWQMRMKQRLFGTIPSREIAFRDLLTIELSQVYLKNFASFLHATGLESRDICMQIGHCLEANFDHLLLVGAEGHFSSAEQVEATRTEADQTFDALIAGLKQQNKQHQAFWNQFHALFRQRLEVDLASPALRISPKKIDGNPEAEEAQVRTHSAKWLANQTLFHNQLQVTVEMQTIRLHLARIIDHMVSDLQTSVFQVAQEGIVAILEVIEKGWDGETQVTREEITLADQKAANIPAFFDEGLLDERLQALRYAMEQLPEKIELQAYAQVEAFQKGRQLDMPVSQLSLRELTNFIVKTYFIAPLEESTLKLPGRYKRIWNQVRDALRLVLFNMSEGGQSVEASIDRRQFKSVLDRAYDQVKEAGESLAELQAETVENLQSGLLACKEHLNPNNLIAQEAMWERSIRGEERLGGLRSGWMRITRRFRNRWDHFLRIWRRTQADLLRAEFETAAARYRNPHARLRDFVDRVRPAAETMRHLPFYYKQLFTGSQGLGSAQMTNREHELELAQVAARRISAGTGGAILILGEAYSGKTYFSEHIAAGLFKGRLYRINPPSEGSCKSEALTAAFRRSLQAQGSVSKMIQGLPRGAVFLLNDLEMWWERRPGGTDAILRIGELIEKFGKTHTFILNAGVHAYPLLRQLTDIDKHMIATIVLSPFTRDNLRRTMMIRHYSGGLHFVWKGKKQEALSSREINQLFARHFDVSSGNIGFALQLWLSHIDSVHSNEMEISSPANLKMPTIQDTGWLVMLTQFVLHKHLNLERLDRIFAGEPRQEIRQQLEGLLRAGLLVEIAPQVYAIDSYVHPFLITSLKQAELL